MKTKIKKMVPEGRETGLGFRDLVWKCIDEGACDIPDRIPDPVCMEYGKEKPFTAAGKQYLSFHDLSAKGEKRIFHTDFWGFHEMIGMFCDIYGRKVLYLSFRCPAYDIYDKEYDDRFDHYYFLCENEKLTTVHYADGSDVFQVTEDTGKLDRKVWQRLERQRWIIFSEFDC